jgi:hypothetical protein
MPEERLRQRNDMTEQDKTYHIIHANVDGAGVIPGMYETLDQAKEAAITMQMRSDEKGNHWHYRYHVFGYGRQFYSTHRGERLAELPAGKPGQQTRRQPQRKE